MLAKAIEILKEKYLCDHCLGRQFALLGFGLSNDERGKIIKNAIILELYEDIQNDASKLAVIQNIAESENELAKKALKRKKIDIENNERLCELCEGMFDRLANIVNDVVKILDKEDYNTFLVGAYFLNELTEKEDNLRGEFRITTGETMKEEFTREIGKRVMQKTGKEPEFKTPDIVVLIDLNKQEIKLEKRSLYIYGRYNKFIRTIPQTRWPCYDCNGKGCSNCNFTGKRYQESVEELIADKILKETGGSNSKFHGAGREDIDALMLGNGRPFVLEILNPKKRTINLQKMKKLVNKYAKKKVQVTDLTFTDKKKVQELKGLATKTQKTYRALIDLEDKIADEKMLLLVKELKGTIIKQKTPTRVIHRRANLERLKTVFDIKVKRINEKQIEADIIGEGGLYIKELISGDDGRTKPSFTQILGCNALCTRLDVIRLHTKDD